VSQQLSLLGDDREPTAAPVRTVEAFDEPVAAGRQLPRELIRASAGSGKTYQISSSIIELLALGERPDEVFASTFTRKAASEILERVLARLAAAALGEKAAAELAEDTRMPGAGPAFWLTVLERTVRELHRLNIGTLDAFFMRSVRSFGHDLGLPPGWTIADTPTIERLRAEALGDVLRQTDGGVLVELVRAISRDRVRNSVHGGLLREAKVLLELNDALDPAVGDPWAGLDAIAAQAPADTRAAREDLAARIAALEPPPTKKGTPDSRWTKNFHKAADALRRGAWEDLVCDGICAKVVSGDSSYCGRTIEDEVHALFTEACELARAVIAVRLAAQAHALRRFTALLAAAVERRRQSAGAYEFGDLARLLADADATGNRDELFYRLDMQTRHMLLDEFQDTSLPQWEALEPLVGEILAGHEGERAALIVADPKQSIYGWRGASPTIVEHVRREYALPVRTLAMSWRSSQVVLDTVNHIFDALEGLSIWEDDPVGAAVAAEWKQGFAEHVAAKLQRPGYTALHVGPRDEGRGQSRPLLCRRAAELTAELHAASPGRSIGVLTRTNATVARILLELKQLGVAASGEGGNPLTDAAPVEAILALLTMADHPGDRIARYLVGTTPLAEVVGFHNWDDDRAARRVAHRTRAQLVEQGYGATLAGIVDRLGDACDARERRRLAQLVELAFRYDDDATLRPADFVRLVREERVEDPSGAGVRVMTVHQSKGLEFDIVVLPDLDAPLTRGTGGKPLAYRPTPTSRVTRIFPPVKKELRPLFHDVPELGAAIDQAHAAAMSDALSGLYVALTRARYALHIVVRADGEKASTAKTSACIVREALAREMPAVEGEILAEHGEPDWHQVPEPGEPEGDDAPVDDRAPPEPASDLAEAVHAAEALLRAGPLLREGARRSRVLPRRSPSDLEGGNEIDLRHVLRLEGAASAERGTIAHAWFECVGWLDDGVPGDDELRRVARRIAPHLPEPELDALLERFRGWLRDPVVVEALTRPGTGSVEVEREVPFIRREGDIVVEGIIDRLVLERTDGRVTGAEIIDFKTDAVERGDGATLDARVAFYRPQIEAYRRAVAGMYGLRPEQVRARLLFVSAGEARQVD
jgi:ATP-dependent helicase/nuclease subunit A